MDLYILFTLVKESIFKKHQLCNIHIYQEQGARYGYNQSLQCQYNLYQSPVWHSTIGTIYAYQAYRSTTKPYLPHWEKVEKYHKCLMVCPCYVRSSVAKFSSEPKFKPEPLGPNSKSSSRFRIFAELNLRSSSRFSQS